MNSHDTITLTGIVATTPRHLRTGEGLEIASFRLASAHRRYDRAAQQWVDTDTNWYTVTTYRQLATNLHGSVNKGDHVLVTGRLRIRQWANGDKTGTTVEVDADAIGHDLGWGTSTFTRNPQTAPADAPEDTAPEDTETTSPATEPDQA